MTPYHRAFFRLGALAGTLGLGLQLYLLIATHPGSTAQAVEQFFSYFTILSNTLFALVCLAHGWNIFPFFRQTGIAGVTTGSMLIVGAVYHLILDALWQPEGLAWIANQLLHTSQPLLAIIGWMAFLKQRLQWKFAFVWLLYPLAYVIYTLIHGAFVSWYPYPFVDVNELGMRQVVLNSFGLAAAFYLVFMGVIALGRRNSIP